MAKKETISEIREKPGMSNAGKYKNVKPQDFAGPNGTYPINTLKRAKSALKLAHFAAKPGNIVKNVLKKYPELEEKKKSPVTYGNNPIKFTGDPDPDKRKKGKKYKTGALIDETDWESQGTGLNVQDINAIEEDEKGQFITSVKGKEGPYVDIKRQDTIRPKKGKHFKMTWGEKDRNFTPNPNRK